MNLEEEFTAISRDEQICCPTFSMLCCHCVCVQPGMQIRVYTTHKLHMCNYRPVCTCGLQFLEYLWPVYKKSIIYLQNTLSQLVYRMRSWLILHSNRHQCVLLYVLLCIERMPSITFTVRGIEYIVNLNLSRRLGFTNSLAGLVGMRQTVCVFCYTECFTVTEKYWV